MTPFLPTAMWPRMPKALASPALRYHHGDIPQDSIESRLLLPAANGPHLPEMCHIVQIQRFRKLRNGLRCRKDQTVTRELPAQKTIHGFLRPADLMAKTVGTPRMRFRQYQKFPRLHIVEPQLTDEEFPRRQILPARRLLPPKPKQYECSDVRNEQQTE